MRQLLPNNTSMVRIGLSSIKLKMWSLKKCTASDGFRCVAIAVVHGEMVGPFRQCFVGYRNIRECSAHARASCECWYGDIRYYRTVRWYKDFRYYRVESWYVNFRYYRTVRWYGDFRYFRVVRWYTEITFTLYFLYS